MFIKITYKDDTFALFEVSPETYRHMRDDFLMGVRQLPYFILKAGQEASIVHVDWEIVRSLIDIAPPKTA